MYHEKIAFLQEKNEKDVGLIEMVAGRGRWSSPGSVRTRTRLDKRRREGASSIHRDISESLDSVRGKIRV